MLNWIYSVKFSVWKPWKVSEAEYERTAVVGIAGLRTEGDLNVLCIVCLYWSIIQKLELNCTRTGKVTSAEKCPLAL